ncbi:MAG: hypothetical protein LBM13_04275 [Candidatus Ancillula sp.]|jgi:hypothetical protein|nr:hypothetical protein [Candidatus Ancillula sp.]
MENTINKISLKSARIIAILAGLLMITGVVLALTMQSNEARAKVGTFGGIKCSEIPGAVSNSANGIAKSDYAQLQVTNSQTIFFVPNGGGCDEVHIISGTGQGTVRSSTGTNISGAQVMVIGGGGGGGLANSQGGFDAAAGGGGGGGNVLGGQNAVISPNSQKIVVGQGGDPWGDINGHDSIFQGLIAKGGLGGKHAYVNQEGNGKEAAGNGGNSGSNKNGGGSRHDHYGKVTGCRVAGGGGGAGATGDGTSGTTSIYHKWSTCKSGGTHGDGGKGGTGQSANGVGLPLIFDGINVHNAGEQYGAGGGGGGAGAETGAGGAHAFKGDGGVSCGGVGGVSSSDGNNGDSGSGCDFGAGGGGGADDSGSGRFRGAGSGANGAIIIRFAMLSDNTIITLNKTKTIKDVIYGSEKYNNPDQSNSQEITIENGGVYPNKIANVSPKGENFSYFKLHDCSPSMGTTLQAKQKMTCHITVNAQNNPGPGIYKANLQVDQVINGKQVIGYSDEFPMTIISPRLTMTACSVYQGQLGQGTVNGSNDAPGPEVGTGLYGRIPDTTNCVGNVGSANDPKPGLILQQPQGFTDQEAKNAGVMIKVSNEDTEVNKVINNNKVTTKIGYKAKVYFSWTPDPKNSANSIEAKKYKIINKNGQDCTNASNAFEIGVGDSNQDCMVQIKDNSSFHADVNPYNVKIYTVEEYTNDFAPQHFSNINTDFAIKNLVYSVQVVSSGLQMVQNTFDKVVIGYKRPDAQPLDIKNDKNPNYDTRIIAVSISNPSAFQLKCQGGTADGTEFIPGKNWPKNLKSPDYDMDDSQVSAFGPQGFTIDIHGENKSACSIQPNANLRTGKYMTDVSVIDRIGKTSQVVTFVVIGPKIEAEPPQFKTNAIGYNRSDASNKTIPMTNSGPIAGDVYQVTISNQDEFDFSCGGSLGAVLGTNGSGGYDKNKQQYFHFQIKPGIWNNDCQIAPKLGLGFGTYVTQLTIWYNGPAYSTLADESHYLINFRVGSSYLVPTAPIFKDAIVGYSDITAEPLEIRNTGTSDATEIQITLPENSPFSLENRSGFDQNTVSASSEDNTSYFLKPKQNLTRGTYFSNVFVTYNYGGVTITAQTSVSFRVLSSDINIHTESWGATQSNYNLQIHPVHITNLGDVLATISEVNSSDTKDFDLQCPTDGDGKFQQFQVNPFDTNDDCKITPKRNLVAGDYMTTLTVRYRDSQGFSNQKEQVLTFTVTDSDVSFDQIDFDPVVVGYSPQSLPIQIHNIGSAEAHLDSLSFDQDGKQYFDITPACLGKSIFSQGMNDDCQVSPKAGLEQGDYSGRLTLVASGKTTTKLVTIKVQTPNLSIATPIFPNMVLGYSSIEDTAIGNGEIKITNNGEADTDFRITANNTDYAGNTDINNSFVLSCNRLSVKVNETNDTCKIKPKLGLKSGDYMASVTISYGQKFSLTQTVVVNFKVLGSHLKVTVPVFPSLGVGYQNYINGANAGVISVENTGESQTGYKIEITSKDFVLLKDGQDTKSDGFAEVDAYQTNNTYTLFPNSGLQPGTYQTQVILTDLSTFATKVMSVYFQVLVPTLEIDVPNYSAVNLGYNSWNSIPVNGAISLTNVGGIKARNIKVEATNADQNNQNWQGNAFTLIGRVGEISPNSTDLSVKLIPKHGLSKGDYYSTITVSYGVDSVNCYKVSAVTHFVVMGSDTAMQIDNFKNLQYGDNPNLVSQKINLYNKGNLNTTVQVTISNNSQFDLIGNCSNIILSENAKDDNCSIAPKTNLSRGSYWVTIFAKDLQNGNIQSKEVSLTVTGAEFDVSVPNFQDEVQGYQDYNTDLSAKAIGVTNVGDKGTTLAVSLEDSTDFVLIEKGANHFIAPAGQKGQLNQDFSLRPQPRLEAGTYQTKLIVKDLESNTQITKQISFTVNAPSLEIVGQKNFNLQYKPFGKYSEQNLSITNNGNIDATNVYVSIDDDVADKFELAYNGGKVTQIAQHKTDTQTWGIMPHIGIEPGDYAVKLTVTDADTKITDTETLMFHIVGEDVNPGLPKHDDQVNYLDLEVEDIQLDAVLPGYKTAPSGQLLVQNTGNENGYYEVSLSDNEYFQLNLNSIESVLPGKTDQSISVSPKENLPVGTYITVVNYKFAPESNELNEEENNELVKTKTANVSFTVTSNLSENKLISKDEIDKKVNQANEEDLTNSNDANQLRVNSGTKGQKELINQLNKDLDKYKKTINTDRKEADNSAEDVGSENGYSKTAKDLSHENSLTIAASQLHAEIGVWFWLLIVIFVLLIIVIASIILIRFKSSRIKKITKKENL